MDAVKVHRGNWQGATFLALNFSWNRRAVTPSFHYRMQNPEQCGTSSSSRFFRPLSSSSCLQLPPPVSSTFPLVLYPRSYALSFLFFSPLTVYTSFVLLFLLFPSLIVSLDFPALHLFFVCFHIIFVYVCKFFSFCPRLFSQASSFIIFFYFMIPFGEIKSDENVTFSALANFYFILCEISYILCIRRIIIIRRYFFITSIDCREDVKQRGNKG